jgi:MinD superfamily P-loop ATPase
MAMQVAVASGKGGTGKTTVAVNLAHVLAEEGPIQLLDCDVEEPNAHLFLHPTQHEVREVNIRVPAVNRARCTGCGKCVEACAFHAIAVLGEKALVFPELCHGCGSCVRVCPTGALHEEPRRLGIVSRGSAGRIDFVQGKIDVGAALAVPVVKAVKRAAWAGDVILDAPPGTSCPVVATIARCDYVLLVTEPTPFGLNDLKLAIELVREMKIPHGVVLNRAGIGTDDVQEYCYRERIPILLRIPFDRRFAETIAHGRLIVQEFPDWRIEFRHLWERVRRGGRG